jgi:hypothetical protein
MDSKISYPNLHFDEKNAIMIRKAEFGKDLEPSFLKGTYLYHGTDCLTGTPYETGILEDKELKIKKSIDNEKAIFFM